MFDKTRNAYSILHGNEPPAELSQELGKLKHVPASELEEKTNGLIKKVKALKEDLCTLPAKILIYKEKIAATHEIFKAMKNPKNSTAVREMDLVTNLSKRMQILKDRILEREIKTEQLEMGLELVKLGFIQMSPERMAGNRRWIDASKESYLPMWRQELGDYMEYLGKHKRTSRIRSKRLKSINLEGLNEYNMHQSLSLTNLAYKSCCRQFAEAEILLPQTEKEIQICKVAIEQYKAQDAKLKLLLTGASTALAFSLSGFWNKVSSYLPK